MMPNRTITLEAHNFVTLAYRANPNNSTDFPFHGRFREVFGFALHPYVLGQPHRLRQLRKVLKHIKQQSEKSGAVWLTTPGAVAAHAAKVLEKPCA